LFKAYLESVPNEEFRLYIQFKRIAHDGGATVTSEELMSHALTTFDTINQRAAYDKSGEPMTVALNAQTSAPAAKPVEDFMARIEASLANIAGDGKRSGASKGNQRRLPDWKKN
jgi:hypothetical protein